MPAVTVRDVFEEAQNGLHCHGHLLKTLEKIMNALPADEFWETFLYHLKCAMLIYQREPAVERVMEFVSKFATSLAAPKEGATNDDDEEEEMNEFLLHFFEFILQSHNANDRAVRFRCCQLINKLLHNMPQNAQIDDDLFDQIYKCMLTRLRDKFPQVRVQAVFSLARLQEPADKHCPVIEAYMFLLGCDPNPEVRRAILTCIATTTKTLPGILERTRDVKDLVRKQAYLVISEKIHIKAITIAQRIKLLKDGLHDRSDMVKEVVISKLLQAWLRMFGGNILELLSSLDVEDSSDISEEAVKTLFKKFPAQQLVEEFELLNDKLLIDAERRTCESVFYWRCITEYIHSLGEEGVDLIDKLFPTGKIYCEYLHSVLEECKKQTDIDKQLEYEYVLQQLVKLAEHLDLADEVGRRALEKFIHDALLADVVNHSLVPALLKLLLKLKQNENTRIQHLVEIIADIRQPIQVIETGVPAEEKRQVELKIASIRVKLNQLREELEECVRKQDFTNAATLKEEIFELETQKTELTHQTQSTYTEKRTEKNDPQTLLKCMTISCEMLKYSKLTCLNPALQTLMEVLILPGVLSQDPAVRNSAVRTLGLCCLMSKEAARAHFLLFMQASQVDQITIQGTALEVIFDLIQTFGLDAFLAEPECDKPSSEDEEKEKGVFSDESVDIDDDSEDIFDNNDDDVVAKIRSRKKKDDRRISRSTVQSIVSILTNLLDSETSEIRTVAAEGLAKLLLSGRLPSPRLFARLVLLWYNPVTEDDTRLRHCLGTFFPIFAFAGSANQGIIEEAFLPILRTLFNAPASSPLADVNINNVTELLIELTCSKHLVVNDTVNQDISFHCSLASKLCNEILDEPNSVCIKTLARCLGLLDYTGISDSEVKDLFVLSERIKQEVKDRTCQRSLEKFHKLIKQLHRNITSSGEPIEEVQKEVDVVPDTQDELETQPTKSKKGKPMLSVKKSKGKKKLHSLSTTESFIQENLEDSSSGEMDASSVFASPTPCRGTAQSRKAPVATVITKTTKERKKLNLDEVLSDSESESDTPKLRRRVKRGHDRNNSLTDIHQGKQPKFSLT